MLIIGLPDGGLVSSHSKLEIEKEETPYGERIFRRPSSEKNLEPLR